LNGSRLAAGVFSKNQKIYFLAVFFSVKAGNMREIASGFFFPGQNDQRAQAAWAEKIDAWIMDSWPHGNLKFA